MLYLESKSAWCKDIAIVLGVVALVSVAEIFLVNRKYGIFSGGFGQSRVLDSASDVLVFAVAYGIAQLFLAMIVWRISVSLTKKQPNWAAAFLLLVLMGGGFVLALSVQYKLHSYFSDAVSFALIKQLGGGSLLDALLFGATEGVTAAFGVVSAALFVWLLWMFLKRNTAKNSVGTHWTPMRSTWVLAATLLVLEFAVPRLWSNAAYGLGRTLIWGITTNALDAATDFDKDGYGIFGTQFDSHPFDVTKHPFAVKVVGGKIEIDGFDDNLLIENVPAARGPMRIPKGAPNLIVVVMESTRGDVIGKRIDGKVVAPNLEALAKTGSVIVPNYSHVGFTTNSLKSMFTGKLEPNMGDPSLFSDLKSSGYRIGVLSGQPEDFGDISKVLQMRKNSDVYVDAETLKDKRAFNFAAKGSLLIDERFLLDAFDREFGSRDKWNQPVFLYFNFQSPHFPYDHPGVAAQVAGAPIPREEINKANQDKVVRTYWNAVANSDAWLGKLMNRLKEIGVWDDTLLLVLGDHGEELFEGGFLGHGHIINDLQYATFFVANRKGVVSGSPMAISDLRDIALDALSGHAHKEDARPKFMYIGTLEKPAQIGFVDSNRQFTTFKFDTWEACFLEKKSCSSYHSLHDDYRRRVDLLVQRWVSELLTARGSLD